MSFDNADNARRVTTLVSDMHAVRIVSGLSAAWPTSRKAVLGLSFAAGKDRVGFLEQSHVLL